MEDFNMSDLACLKKLMENEVVQNMVTEGEEMIVAANDMLGEFPQVVKNYVNENIDTFIGEDVKETFSNIVTFTESAVQQFLDETTNQMVDESVAA